MNRVLNWLASWRQTLQVAVYGPQVLGPRREPTHRIPTDSDLADALNLNRVVLVSDPELEEARRRHAPVEPIYQARKERVNKALAGGAK